MIPRVFAVFPRSVVHPDVVGGVAQSCSLPFRRFAIGRASANSGASDPANALQDPNPAIRQITNLRYAFELTHAVIGALAEHTGGPEQINIERIEFRSWLRPARRRSGHAVARVLPNSCCLSNIS